MRSPRARGCCATTIRRPAVALLGGAQFFILGVRDILYAVLAIDVLGVGEQGAGILAAAVGVGGLVGRGRDVACSWAACGSPRRSRSPSARRRARRRRSRSWWRWGRRS